MGERIARALGQYGPVGGVISLPHCLPSQAEPDRAEVQSRQDKRGSSCSLGAPTIQTQPGKFDVQCREANVASVPATNDPVLPFLLTEMQLHFNRLIPSYLRVLQISRSIPLHSPQPPLRMRSITPCLRPPRARAVHPEQGRLISGMHHQGRFLCM